MMARACERRHADPTLGFSTLQKDQRITVRDGGREIANLNDLEQVKGEIYANV
jgi:glutamine cyclotransferase